MSYNEDEGGATELAPPPQPVDASVWLREKLNPTNVPGKVSLKKFKRENLAKILRLMHLKKGAEVGVADGRHSLMLCQNIPGLDLTCVDPWMKYKGNPRGGPQTQHDGNYELAKGRLAPFNARLVKGKSLDVARDIQNESLDFVYIDGNHSFDYVMEDMISWGRKVRHGGVIAGHDYYDFDWAGVIEAVQAYVGAHRVPFYFVAVDEREPTWFFAKGPDWFPHRGW